MDGTFSLPKTDGYIAYPNGEIYRPIGKGHYEEIPERLIRGYLYCHVVLNGKYRTVRKNNILCRAFHGEPPTQRHVARHLDDNKTNNSFENLKWGTPKENSADAKRNGVNSTAILKSGEHHLNAKLKESDVLDIRFALSNGARNKDIARIYGLSRPTITDIKNRKTWRNL